MGVIMVYKPTYNWGGPSCRRKKHIPGLASHRALRAMFTSVWQPFKASTGIQPPKKDKTVK